MQQIIEVLCERRSIAFWQFVLFGAIVGAIACPLGAMLERMSH